MREAPPGGTAAAATVADILMLFLNSRHGRLGVSEISRSLGISKAVVYRSLQSLQDRQLVLFNDHRRKYVLGPSLLGLGATALHNADLRVAAMPALTWLQAESRATATVSALVGIRRMFLDQVVSGEELRLSVEIGKLLPLHIGASGRAILAFAPPSLQEQVLAEELPSYTSNSIADRTRLQQAMDDIRHEGVAVSRGERTHVSGSVAVPVLSFGGTAVGSVAACGPVAGFTDEHVRELIPLVKRAAADVSRRLGDLLRSLAPGEPG
jgi:DNA-binding IclR family transcriptional regulator